MTKVAIYVRVSTESQETDRQKAELQAFAQKNEFDVYKIYEDKVSGMKSDKERLYLHNLIQDASEHKFDAILFSEFSRLSRKVLDLNVYIEKFKEMGIELYFQKQNLWVNKQGDSLNQISTDILLQVLAIVSRYEIELFAERTQSGKINAIKQKGKFQGGTINYGYECTDGIIHINDEEAKIVRKLFQMYANGTSMYELVRYLNANNIPTAKQTRIPKTQARRVDKGIGEKEYKFDIDTLVWNKSSVSKILKNTIYIGKQSFVFHKPNIEGNKVREIMDSFTTESEDLRIISDELFEKVQDRLKYNFENRFTPKKRVFLLRRILKCGYCNSSLLAKRNTRGILYSCFNGSSMGRAMGDKKCTKSSNINIEKLDGAIVYSIFRYILLFKTFDDNKEQNDTYKELIQQNNDLIKAKEKELNKLETKWLSYFDRAIEHNISDDHINRVKSKIDNDKAIILSEIKRLKNDNETYKENIELIQKSKAFDFENIEEYLLPENHTKIRTILNEYIDKILYFTLDKRFGYAEVHFKNKAIKGIILKNGKIGKMDYAVNHIKSIVDEDTANKLISDLRIKDTDLMCIDLDNDLNSKYDSENNTFQFFGKTYSGVELYNHCINNFVKYTSFLKFYSLFEYKEFINEENPKD